MLSSGSDLLTAVTDGTVSTGSKQNNTVSYDEMGNPTRYFGATMTWAGKQLSIGANPESMSTLHTTRTVFAHRKTPTES